MKISFLILTILSLSFSRTYYDDTLVVRQILDLNGLESSSVDSATDSSGGRITVLRLINVDTVTRLIIELDSLKVLVLANSNYPPLYKLRLAKEFWYQRNLVELGFLSCMVDLSSDIINLTGLKKFVFYQGITGNVPGEIWGLNNLEYLDIRYGNGMPIGTYPAPLGNLIKLKTLYFSYNAEPSVFTLPVSLEYIYMVQSGFTRMPQQLFTCTNIKALVVELSEIGAMQKPFPEKFGIDSLSVEISNMKKLNTLDLELTNLKYLPPEISMLTELTSLDLSYNSLKELPDSIISLNKTKVDLDNNYLCNLPPFIQQWADTCAIGWRETQDCSSLVKKKKLPALNQELIIKSNISSQTVIFSLPQQAKKIIIYDTFGRLIYSAAPSENIFIWRGENMAGRTVTFGTYIAKVITKANDIPRPFILSK